MVGNSEYISASLYLHNAHILNFTYRVVRINRVSVHICNHIYYSCYKNIIDKASFRVIPFLLSKANITVVTNGVRALISLADFNINTISTGGRLVNSRLALVGDEAYKTIDSINANIAFFSCRGLSDDGYLTAISPEEDYVRQRISVNTFKHNNYNT